MSFLPVPSQSNVQVAIRAFLLSILPAGTECVEGQSNDVPEPTVGNFVVMTTIRRERIETNVDTYADCAFTGSIVALVMTVTAVRFGSITIGNTLFGVNVAAGTTIAGQTSGPAGGIGTYTVSPTQTVASETLACGVQNILQPTKVTIQLDVHSDKVGDANNMAQTIATLLRDDYAMRFFKAQGFDVMPLYAEDPRQMPFINAEQNWETRYVVDVVLQANQVIAPPQQFADHLIVQTIEVDTTYPP